MDRWAAGLETLEKLVRILNQLMLQSIPAVCPSRCVPGYYGNVFVS